MELFELTAILFCVTFIFGYLNYRFLRLPQTIGLMSVAMIFSLGLVIFNAFGVSFIGNFATDILEKIDFNETLMIGMLGFLLFSGSLDLNINDLMNKKVEVSVFSIFSTVLSMLIIGISMFGIFHFFGLPISLSYSLLFGALISPTDPVAVLGILKTAKAPKSLETKIAGESLFNDGIGVVLFLGVYGSAISGEPTSMKEFGLLFMSEAVGGLLLGIIAGYITYLILKKINNFQLEIIGTIALVMVISVLAFHLHMSGPIAIVAAGLLIGNHGRKFAMSEETREHLDSFWLLVDAILNALLFVLIGLEFTILKFSLLNIIIGLIAIVVVLVARYISVAFPVIVMKLLNRRFTQGVINIMTWGGLRGGISIALVMSLPQGFEKDILLSVTYIIVVFSILVQGLTIKSFINWQLNKAQTIGKLKGLFN